MLAQVHILDLLAGYWGLAVAVLIVVLGLFVIGWQDIRRFSFRRAWAIAGVCFAESIRKRVLWITPLAIAAVIGITQFQRTIDEQDSVRQTLKICLFATGVVVMLTSIILAATNLPKEIETRVIFTIVTKPPTRFELILGKVMGFARVSLAIVFIMGLFTWGYVRLIAVRKTHEIAYRLREGDISDTERARLSEYQRTGLLAARSLWSADELGVYGRAPDPASHVRVICNAGDQDVLAGYLNDRVQLFGPQASSDEQWAQGGIGTFGMVIRVDLNSHRTGPATDQPSAPPGIIGPILPQHRSASTAFVPPTVSIELLDGKFFTLLQPRELLGAPSEAELANEISAYFKTGLKIDPAHAAGNVRLSEPVRLPDIGQTQVAYAWVPPQPALALFRHDKFYVRVSGVSANVDYQIGPQPVAVFVPRLVNNMWALTPPGAAVLAPLPSPDGGPEELIFRGRIGIQYDQEVDGGPDPSAAVAFFSFRDAPSPQIVDGQIPFELNAQVERRDSEIAVGHEDPTTLDVRLIDLASQKTTLLPPVLIESRQPASFTVPAQALAGHNYDLVLHCQNAGQIIGLFPTSLHLVTARQSFEWNLSKSLSIIWMMSILVITLAVLSSTFVSWPIAIVLTVMLLLGHWGVDQLADSTGTGLGRQIVQGWSITDAPEAKVISSGVDTLSTALRYISRVLPDTSKFDAIQEIEQGVTISIGTWADALGLLAMFAIPATVIAYLILRGREVAP